MGKRAAVLNHMNERHDDGWGQLYAQSFGPLTRFAQHLGVAAADSEDVVQDAMFRFLARAPGLDPRKNALGLFRRMVYWSAMDYHRRARCRPQTLSSSDGWQPLPSPEQRDCSEEIEERAEVSVALAWVTAELRRLPRDWQVVLVRKGLGYTDEEQAATLGLPVGTLKGWIRQGREYLKAELPRG